MLHDAGRAREILDRGGVAALNEAIRETHGEVLRGQDLRGCQLRGCNLANANLRALGVDLRGAYLFGADLSGAQVAGSGCLIGANLAQANLERADLRCANISGCNFAKANMAGARLSISQLNRNRSLGRARNIADADVPIDFSGGSGMFGSNLTAPVSPPLKTGDGRRRAHKRRLPDGRITDVRESTAQRPRVLRAVLSVLRPQPRKRRRR